MHPIVPIESITYSDAERNTHMTNSNYHYDIIAQCHVQAMYKHTTNTETYTWRSEIDAEVFIWIVTKQKELPNISMFLRFHMLFHMLVITIQMLLKRIMLTSNVA